MSDDVTFAPADASLAVRRPALLQLWADVTNAGGAVGLRPPADPASVAPLVDEMLAELAARVSGAVVARDTDGEIVGLVVVTPGPAPRRDHVARLRRLMVHPTRQGEGLGGELLAAGERLAATDLGAELALVEVRHGQGTERFYERLGYREVGRIPGGLAFEDGDRCDELLLVRSLRS